MRIYQKQPPFACIPKNGRGWFLRKLYESVEHIAGGPHLLAAPGDIPKHVLLALVELYLLGDEQLTGRHRSAEP
jgi:hypothetical protein